MVVDQPTTEVSQTTDTNNSTTSSSTQEETDTRTPQELAKTTTIENNWNTTPLSTTTNPQNPANTFTVFPSLPTELRLLIWKAAAHSPRVLPLKQQKCPRVRRQLAYIEQRTHNPIPSILLTNREARLEGLHYYTKIFGSHLFMRPLSDQARQTLMPRPEMLTSYVKYPTVHWNGGVDTIYFCEKYCDIPWGVHCSSDIPIRSIAFDVQVLFNRVDWEKKLFRVFEKFPIEEVYIVVRKNTVKDEELEREMEFVELTEKGDIHYGERGVARMNLYYDTHMDWTVWKDLQTKLATPERMVRYRFNYWNPKGESIIEDVALKCLC
ncbi:hypothetical protein B0J14DRAFT_140058 [Halenospora varia]|nr:hypothetical protein B0J14DRAFT_140058 [Halenospora varia]